MILLVFDFGNCLGGIGSLSAAYSIKRTLLFYFLYNNHNWCLGKSCGGAMPSGLADDFVLYFGDCLEA